MTFAATVDVIAAAAAIVGVVIAVAVLVDQVRARRPTLHVNFSGSMGQADKVVLPLQIRNDSDTVVQKLSGVLLLDGSPVPGSEFGPMTVAPHSEPRLDRALARPSLADLEPGGKPTFYGKRLSVKITFDRWGSAEVDYGEARSVR
jgi:hypothetical protein